MTAEEKKSRRGEERGGGNGAAAGPAAPAGAGSTPAEPQQGGEAEAGPAAPPGVERRVSGAGDPAAELAQVRAALGQKEAEAASNYDRFLRERAELDNFKKRTRREQAEQLRFAAESLIRELLPVMDNLERAVSHAAEGGDGAPLIEGVSLVLKALAEVLRRHGVRVVDADPGQEFDPSKHEAVGRQEGGAAPNCIVSQHEKGYFLHGRLLRAAKVVVACGDHPGGGVEKIEGDD